MEVMLKLGEVKHAEVLNKNEEETTHFDGNTNKYCLLCDATDIVDFCVHAMGISKTQLTKEKLTQVGCHPKEM